MGGAPVDVHSYLSVECLYFVLHLSFCLSLYWSPLSFLPFFFFFLIANFTASPKRMGGEIVEKTALFFPLSFTPVFVLKSNIMQKSIMRGQNAFAPNELFIILWTNSRDLKAREKEV